MTTSGRTRCPVHSSGRNMRQGVADLQSSKEADLQNVELPTWFVMESRGGEDWLRPSHPLNDVGEQDEVTYAIAGRVPACALWNLLDCRDEDGVPLMTVVEWLRFIQTRSQVDQDWMQAVMTRVLLGLEDCLRSLSWECTAVGEHHTEP